MDSMNHQQVDHEAHRVQASRDELVERITRAVPEDGSVEPLKGLSLHRSSSPKEPLHSVSDPAFCVIAQGSAGRCGTARQASGHLYRSSLPRSADHA